MRVAALTLAGLALLVLAAHFYRSGAMIPTGLCLASVALLFVRTAWARRGLQLILALGTVEWLRTAFRIAGIRALHDAPWGRMALILGTVAALTALSAVLLQTRALGGYFSGGDRHDGAETR